MPDSLRSLLGLSSRKSCNFQRLTSPCGEAPPSASRQVLKKIAKKDFISVTRCLIVVGVLHSIDGRAGKGASVRRGDFVRTRVGLWRAGRGDKVWLSW